MNKTVVIRDVKRKSFKVGMEIITNGLSSGEFKCNGYKIVNNELFISQYSTKCEKFAYEFNLQQVIEFAWGWFKTAVPSANEPDTDGSTAVAFELSTERCGIGSDDWGMCCSIKPIWFIYGK